jgi:hypothetical protein
LPPKPDDSKQNNSDKPGNDGKGEHHAVFGKRYVQALEEKARVARGRAKMRAVAASRDGSSEDFEADNKESPSDADVATIAYGPERFGYVQFRIQKKK